MKIEELGLSARAYNCLRRARIDTVEQLQQMTDDDLLRIRNMGARTVEEIREKVVYIKTMTIGDKIRSMTDQELAEAAAEEYSKMYVHTMKTQNADVSQLFIESLKHHAYHHYLQLLRMTVHELESPPVFPPKPMPVLNPLSLRFFEDKQESGLLED